MGAFVYPIEEIRAKCDLVEIVSAHVALRKSGRRLMGLCPFHNEKTPSFNVDPERKVWKCFGCGEGGDVFTFVQKMDNLTFPEAVEMLARRAGVPIERSPQAVRQLSERDRLFKANSVACTFFQNALGSSRKAKDYLERRGLGQDAVDKYRLGYAPDSWGELTDYLESHSINLQEASRAGLVVPRERSSGHYDRFRDRLMFPILDVTDRVVAFGGRTLGDDPAKYLNSPETPLFHKNQMLYGLNVARRAMASLDQVIVVEGYMDTITTQMAGFENAVATMGTALTEEHVNVIARFTKNVVLAFDADSAGMAAALRSWPIFERAGFLVRILSMPKGEDPDSLLRDGDTSRFAALLEKALPVSDYRVKLALSKHDLKTDEGKTAALREAAAVMAEMDSVMERERLIRKLVRYHPGFSTGTTLAEDHLRSEVEQLRRQVRRPTVEKAASQGDRPAARPAERLSMIEHSERLLLGMIILHGADASKVFESVPPKDFTGEESRHLAEMLSRHFAERGKIDSGVLRSEVAGTVAEHLLTDILIGLDESELEHPAEEVVRGIINRKKYERQIRMRALAQKIQEGSLRKDDEEYEEYWQLVRESSGPWHR